MADSTKPFAFSQFVPGFDFLRSLTGGGAGGAVPGLSGLSNWVAPTLSVEELDKRINELKTVQYWLDQNVHALKATIQALEVQKMTLSTLQGMNVRMEDLANAFTRSTVSAAEAMRQAAGASAAEAKAPEPEPAVEPEEEDAPEDTATAAAAETDAAADASADEPAGKGGRKGGKKADPSAALGVVDTLQWWNSLTQQFQQIASNALQDAAQLKMPGQPEGGASSAPAAPKARASTGRAKAAAPAATRRSGASAGAKPAVKTARKPAGKAAAKPASKASSTRKR